jgi:uncharacterized protein involved in exopolysaccharide biosynthesis
VSDGTEDEILKNDRGRLPGTYPPPYWYFPLESQADEISLADLLSIVNANKWLILAVAFVCTALSVVYVLVATPTYRAETLLAPVEGESKSGLAALAQRFGGLADLAGIPLHEEANIEKAIATLESRDFLTRFIREEQLKPVLFPDDWDREKRSWISSGPGPLDKIERLFGRERPDTRDPRLAPGEPTDWDAFELFREKVLEVSSNSTTGLVMLAVEWPDPALAASWANLLVQRLNAELREQAVEREDKSIQYLRQQIDQTSLADLRTVLFRLIEEHTQTMTLAKVNKEYVFQVIDPATVPQEPAWPRLYLIAVVGLFSGILLGLIASFLRAAMHRSEGAPK